MASADLLVFVDTWAWLALAFRRDQHHERATRQHEEFAGAGRRYVTTDYVLAESTTQLYRCMDPADAQRFLETLFASIETGHIQLELVSQIRFSAAWKLRRQYIDKPDISFVDFTSFAVMRELGVTDAFTGDSHFIQVNLGFRLFPES